MTEPREYKAPTFVPSSVHPSVFLAGAIDMGKAERWQDIAAQKLIKEGISVINPRRDDWDASWSQSPEFPPFREQVEWELDHLLERSDFVLLHLPASSMAPISLLELGLLVAGCPERVVVSCEPGYPREGNVRIVCERVEVFVYDDLGDALDAVVLLARG